jgi:elongation factor Ts
MAASTAQTVKELREKTGAGVLDCKKALDLHEGNLEKAANYLREKGMAAAAKRSERVAREGLIGSYIHAGSKIAALVELNCETDFVARTEEFKTLAHDLAMQVVAAKPLYLAPADVPEDLIEKDLADRGLSGEAAREKYLAEICLLEQPFIKDPALTIRDLVQQRNAVFGENLVVRRFVRFEVGG